MTSIESQQDDDTQPFSPWVYEAHSNRSKALRESTTTYRLSEGTNSTTPHTYSQGHPGHVDLVGAFEPPEVVDGEDLEAANGDEISGFSQVDVRAELYPESRRFREPKTPATTGKKRDNQGEVLLSAARTPRLPVNPFAGYAKESSGVMALSQVFQATQAASSPYAHILPSEGPSERPSPAMFTAHRPSTAGSFSSPAKIPWASLQRSVTEPQANYVSMQESQAERERYSRKRELSSPVTKGTQLQDRSDDEFESEESLLMRRLNQKRIKLEATKQFLGITAPPRPVSSEHNSKARKTGKPRLNQSPVVRRTVPNTMIISDDMPTDDLEQNITEDETEHEEYPGAPESESSDELAEDDKENFDINRVHQSIKSPNHDRRSMRGKSVQMSPAKQHHRDLSSRNDGPDELAVVADLQGRNNNIDSLSSIFRNSQTIAIADSQPSRVSTRLRNQQSGSRNLSSSLISSPRSRMLIPQSQTRQSSQTSPSDLSMARHLTDESSLNPTQRSLPVQSSGSRNAQGSSPPLLSTLNNRQAPTILSETQQREPDEVFGSSPPQVSRQTRIIRTHQLGSSTAEESQGLKAVLDKVTTLTQDVLTELPPILPDPKASKQPTNHMQSTDNEARTPHHGDATLGSTIPETSSIVRRIRVDSPSNLSSNLVHPNILLRPSEMGSDSLQSPQHSKSSTLFDTAQTHPNNSLAKVHGQELPNSPGTAISPVNQKSRMRKFVDIAAEPSSPNEVGEVDVDIGLMTSEDLDFQSIIEGSSPIGPTRKRRRGYGGRSIRIPEPISSSAEQAKPATHQPEVSLEDNNSHLSQGGEQKTSVAVDKPCQQDVRSDALLGSKAASTTTNEKPEAPMAMRSQTDNLAVEQTSVQTSSSEISEMTSEIEANTTVLGNIRKPKHVPKPALVQSSSCKAVAPNRIFALFKGNCAGFYPATCLAVLSGGEPRYKVRFDDGTVDIVNAYGVKRLELRIGDVVKIDRPGARKNNYVVQGFCGKEMPGAISEIDTPTRTSLDVSIMTSRFTPTDIFGYRTVLLALKQKSSAPLVNGKEESEPVPLASIYLTKMMWNNFKDRSFAHRPSRPIFTSGLQTPSDRASTPSTPSTRSRRLKVSIQSLSSNGQSTTTSRSSSCLFENMVFGITNVEDDHVRQQTIRNLRHHGGYLVDHVYGFERLFDVPDLGAAESPSTRSLSTSENTFGLTPSAARRGFTCLIADKHCRSAKFIQALALGIPCLATRWVQDCVNKQRIIAWEPYLLPSGESTFLGGAVRTRLLPSSSPKSILLAQMIENRPRLLLGCSVLLVMGKGREVERMKAYPFIAYALGARKVAQANSLESARQALLMAEAEGEEWDWVYFYDGGGEKAMEGNVQTHAEDVLFPSRGGYGSGSASTSAKGRKRKRGSEVLRNRGRTRVVVTEYVIQSLILGMLMD